MNIFEEESFDIEANMLSLETGGCCVSTGIAVLVATGSSTVSIGSPAGSCLFRFRLRFRFRLFLGSSPFVSFTGWAFFFFFFTGSPFHSASLYFLVIKSLLTLRKTKTYLLFLCFYCFYCFVRCLNRLFNFWANFIFFHRKQKSLKYNLFLIILVNQHQFFNTRIDSPALLMNVLSFKKTSRTSRKTWKVLPFFFEFPNACFFAKFSQKLKLFFLKEYV